MNINGLSILIPVYNKGVRTLVQSLVNQCLLLQINFELLCYDDDSLPRFKEANGNIADLKNTYYTLLQENHGRSKIRNLMAANAKYDWLLFLDCDSLIIHSNFIANYVSILHDLAANSSTKVIYGGTAYQSQRPTNDKAIHWYYGSKVESEIASERALHPFESFKTNNFLIAKEIFDFIRFDETIVTYGYEDVLFAMDVQEHNIQVAHIDNAVLHDGIESNDIYLQKISQSIFNLKTLKSNGRKISTRLSRTAEKLIGHSVILRLTKGLRNKLLLVCECIIKKYPSKIFFLQLWKLLKYLNED